MKLLKIVVAVFLFGVFYQGYSQTETVKKEDPSIYDPDDSSLLPDKFIFTQRMLWGEKGLIRNFNKFELSAESRQRESKIRRNMFVAHQVTGFATAGAMLAQGIIGSQLYKGNYKNYELHEALATGINIGYTTTASLALFAPPRAYDERKGFTKLKLHRALAIVHISGMIATNILAGQLEENYDLRPYHRAAAITTFGAFATSMIIIKF
jgi:hypothetical protein